ncbi:hypothetical protein [Umezawaea beigongshangensis]|uniref:hypothetical protein n=1 Tax=Umezawaea beigongshangensis TaxID=2780383 RepID=UPI0018F1A863|nr:hypothetical protein [Umezawaea beigongshangensis]
MRRGTARLIAAGLAVLAAVPAGCSDGGHDGGQSTRVVPAPSVVLERAPAPTDRELVLRIGFSALSSGPDALADVEVRQSADSVGIRITVRERVPGDDEAVSNSAFTATETVRLDQPVGDATVVDLNRDPPAEIRALSGG